MGKLSDALNTLNAKYGNCFNANFKPIILTFLSLLIYLIKNRFSFLLLKPPHKGKFIIL